LRPRESHQGTSAFAPHRVRRRTPRKGQIVHARHRQWLVDVVEPGDADESPLVRLIWLDDDDPRRVAALWISNERTCDPSSRAEVRMGGDQDPRKAKRRELIELVASIDGVDADLAARIVDSLCSISPPEEPEHVMEWVTMDMGGHRGGRSLKPGNLTLNMKHFVATAASSVVAAAGVAARPWLAPFAAVVLWERVWSKVGVEVQEREASVLWAMWLNRDIETNRIAQAGLLATVNDERAQYGRATLAAQELDDSLEILRKMRCIKHRDDGAWWLCEWVRVNWR